MTPLEERAVLPFYLKLMGSNAVEYNRGSFADDEPLWAELIDVGRSVDLLDVKWLLNAGAWRPVVMGAWLSLRFDDEQIGMELRRAMRSSGGDLTAAPLATACVLVAGTEAIPDLEHFASSEADGSVHFVAAAIGELTGRRETIIGGREVSDLLRRMLAFGTKLRHELRNG